MDFSGETTAHLTCKQIQTTLRSIADPVIAEHSQRFFKTGKGGYGEGDRFLGIRVPILRKHVSIFQGISLTETRKLLRSHFHEERLFALLLLVRKFEKGDVVTREAVYNLYFGNLEFVNNWDLVDSSAPYIVGQWLSDKSRERLYILAKSENLWERRIAIISTFHFIRNNSFSDALRIALLLKHDKEDLIHKAVGWMLREVGKRDPAVEKTFLREHYREMPRTMLRYAIERFPEQERKKYLEGKAS